MSLLRLLRDECGATVVEYAMVLGWFAIAAMVGFGLVAVNAGGRYSAGTTTMTTTQEVPPVAVTP